MPVTVSATKAVSFRSPYIGSTFQNLTEDILGRDGYISGGKTTDDAAVITVELVKFVQRGIFVESTEDVVGLAVPAAAEPWFLLGAAPDDDPDSGAIISVTADPVVASTALILAVKDQGVWRNALSVDVKAAALSAVQPGKVDGFNVRQTAAAGVVTGLIVGNGRYVDVDGHLREIVGPDGAGDLATLAPLATENVYHRNDWLVLRQAEGFEPSLEMLQGGVKTSLDSHGGLQDYPPVADGTGAGFYGVRGLYRSSSSPTPSCKAWGELTNLRTQGGDGGSGWAVLTSYGGSSTIDNVNVAGQRAGDGAFIIVFTEGDDLKMVSINEATGVVVDAPVTIDTEVNAISRVHAVMNSEENLYVTYEHQEVNKQIFYTKRITTAGGTFGNSSVAPRYVNGAIGSGAGSATGTDDTFPTLGVDSKGIVHVAYVANIDMVYSVFETDGILRSKKTVAAFGRDVDPTDEIPFAAAIFTGVQQTSLVVTPHDEVFVATLGLLDGDGDFHDIVLFSPTFEDRLGFEAVSVIRFPLKEVKFVTMVAGEQGELWLAWVRVRDADALNDELRGCVLDPVFAPNGLAWESITGADTPRLVAGAAGYPPDPTPGTGEWDDFVADVVVAAEGFSEPFRAFRTSDGLMAISYVASAGGTDDPRIELAQPIQFRDPKPHPRDVYLAVVGNVPPVAADGTAEERSNQRIQQVRHSGRKNDPLIVGIDGDYGGINGLASAAAAIARTGGRVVVRPGEHIHTTAIHIYGGTEILGQGANIEWPSQSDGQVDWALYMGDWHTDFTVASILQSATPFGTCRVTLNEPLGPWIREGDFIRSGGGAASPEHHRIRRIIQRTPTAIIETDLEGVDADATLVRFLAAGILIDGLSVEQWRHGAADSAFSAKHCFELRVRNCSIVGDSTSTQGSFRLDSCYNSVLDGIQSGMLSGQANIQMIGGAFNKVINTHLGDKDPATGVPAGLRVDVNATEEWPAVENCSHSSGSNGLTIDSGRTTPVNVASTGGPIQGGTPMFMGREKNFAGVHFGFAPTQGAFPQIDFTAGEARVDGFYVTPAAQSNSDATAGSTTYWYVVDRSGTVSQLNINPIISGFAFLLDGLTLICRATTNAGNTAWDDFTDMRRYVNQPDRKGPFIVSDPANTEAQYNCATLQGAIQWLTDTADGNQQEIIITEQIDMSGQLPIAIDFQAGAMKSLTIRGIGEDAGFTSNQDEDFFVITGLASENASTAAGQKASLRIHNLLFDSSNAAGPTDKSLFEFVASSYFTDITIDSCRTQSNPGLGWNNFIRLNCDADQVTIAHNVVDDGRGDGATSACIYGGGTNVVKNCHIFRNTFRQDATSMIGTAGIDISQTFQKVWIVENNFEPGRDVGAGHQVFADPIVVDSMDMSDGLISGSRWIVGNVFFHTEFTNGFSNPAIQTTDSGSALGNASPFYIINNTIYNEFNGGILAAGGGKGTKIIGNHVEMSNQNTQDGISCDSIHSVIANNSVLGGGGTSVIGIAARDGRTTVVGNTVEITGEAGIRCFTAGDIPFDFTVVGNVVFGSYSDASIRIDSDTTTVVGNRVVNSHTTSGRGIYLSGNNDRCSIVGNTVSSKWVGISTVSTVLDCTFAGNNVLVDGTNSTAKAAAFGGKRHAITGNTFRSIGAADLPAATLFTVSECAVSGNYFGGRLGADYGAGGNGQHACEIDGPNNAFSGNVFENQGTSLGKATITLSALADNNTFVGNTIRNIHGTPFYFEVIAGASGNEYGTAGAAVPGANKQTNT